VQGLLGPGDGKQAEARGVEHEDRRAQPVDHVRREEPENTRRRRRREIAPVHDGRRRHGADQQVARQPAGDPGQPGNDQHPEQVQLLAHAPRGAADREHEGGGQIHGIEQHAGTLQRLPSVAEMPECGMEPA
jgi:hypothetical protein